MNSVVPSACIRRRSTPHTSATSVCRSRNRWSRRCADHLTPAGLAELAAFVNGIGPDKAQIIPRNADNTLGRPTALVANAHGAGLVLHPYTFRAENQFLPADFQVGADANAYGRALDEQLTFLRAGIDGLFTDQADIGVLARHILASGLPVHP